jgi:D-amino-acid dehydrogenase
VLVIGGGVAGVCSAYFLAKDGCNVTLIDKADVCAGCSYGNAGWIVPSYCVPMPVPGIWLKGLAWLLDPEGPFYIKPRLDGDLLAWLLRFTFACSKRRVDAAIPVLRDLSHASLTLFKDFSTMRELDFGFRRDGLLKVFRTAAGFDAAVKESQLLHVAGLESKILDRFTTLTFEPSLLPDIVGAVFYPNDAHIIPDAFVSGVAGLAAKMGVKFRSDTEVIGFKTEGTKIRAAESTRGEFEADEFVLAAGAWSAPLTREIGLNVPIQPAKGYSITCVRPSISPAIPLSLGEVKVAITPMGEFLRLGGTLELAGLDLSINRRRVEKIRESAALYVNGVEQLRAVEVWRGLRPCTPDGLPIIGRSSRFENMVFATGHGMLGISLGPVTGKLVADLVAEKSPLTDISALGPDRFN